MVVNGPSGWVKRGAPHLRSRGPRGSAGPGIGHPSGVALGIGPDVELDRVIVDKNARIGEGCRLVNAQGLQTFDGPNYHIREGILIVPKDAVIAPGTVV